MTQYAFFFDGTRCTGCQTCVFACKDKNNLGIGTTYRRVYEYTGGETTVDSAGFYATTCYSYYLPVSCNHCDSPACVEVCPTGAMHKDAGTGLVSVDASKCVGCGYCHRACPYNAPKVDREKGHSVKCDGCADLVAKGEKPACVMACPALALQFGAIEEIKTLGERAAIAPLPAPLYTTPNVFILACKDAKPVDDTTGSIANPLEVQ